MNLFTGQETAECSVPVCPEPNLPVQWVNRMEDDTMSPARCACACAVYAAACKEGAAFMGTVRGGRERAVRAQHACHLRLHVAVQKRVIRQCAPQRRGQMLP